MTKPKPIIDPYRRRRDVTLDGPWPNRVSTTVVRNHVRRLGVRYKAVAEVTGLPLKMVDNRDTKWTRTEVATAILALRAEDFSNLDGTVPAAGTARRVQALVYLGHPYADIAARVGLSDAQVAWNLAHLRRTRIPVAVAAAVADVYDRTPVDVLGPDSDLRWRARVDGWQSPLAWDDLDIDDPAVLPAVDVERAGDDGEEDLDREAIRRALAGDAKVALRLTYEEKLAAARIGLARGLTQTAVAELLRANGQRLAEAVAA